MRLSIQNPEYEIAELRARVEKLEEHVYKKKRTPTTLGQQILLLNILGILDSFYSLPMTNLMRAKLLSRILNTDESNTKKALEALPKKHDKNIHNPANYQFLQNLFEEVGLTSYANKAHQKIKELEITKTR